MRSRPGFVIIMIVAMAVILPAAAASGQTPVYATSTLQHYTGGGTVACPCFAVGEEAGVVFTDIPADRFPIEILRVGIGWGSYYNTNPPQLEHYIHIYNGQLPDPGARIFSLLGPQLNDGAINEFNLETEPGEIIVESGSVAVTLEFYNPNAGDPFASTVVHDGNGCQPGKNLVFAEPGIWYDACMLGVTGDWIFYMVYRYVDYISGVEEVAYAGTLPTATLHPCYPNPFNPQTRIAFDLPLDEAVNLTIYDMTGARIKTLADGHLDAGPHEFSWNGTDEAGRRTPSGVYLYRLQTERSTETRRMVLMK